MKNLYSLKIIVFFLLFNLIYSYPNDPKYVDGSQWYIHNDFNENTTLMNDLDLDLLEAWDITKGSSNVVIAILDSGIPMSNGQLSHPDLNDANRIILGKDYINNSAEFNDIDGHGTRVTGIVGAETNNGIGVAGVAPLCRLAIFKVWEEDILNDVHAQNIYDAIQEMVIFQNQNPGYRFVVNISYAFYVDVPKLRNAISLAAANNILIVAGTGNYNLNSNYDVTYPAKYSAEYDNLIAVGSVNKKGAWANYSCYGPEVTVCAPGSDIWSTVKSGGYGYAEGTSYSTPMVAGLAGLMLSIDPNLTPSEIRTKMIESARDLGDSGFDNKTGHGLINAYKTLARLFKEKNSSTHSLTIGNLNLTQQASNLYVSLEQKSPSGVVAGHYFVDRYVATKTFSTSLLNPSVYYLGMKGYRSVGNQYVLPTDYYLSESTNNNTTTYTTYFYYVRKTSNGEEVNKWVPWNPNIDGGLEYSILGEYGPLTAEISGPSSLEQYEEGTWTCVVNGGRSPFFYTWSYYLYCAGGLELKVCRK